MSVVGRMVLPALQIRQQYNISMAGVGKPKTVWSDSRPTPQVLPITMTLCKYLKDHQLLLPRTSYLLTPTGSLRRARNTGILD